MKKLIDGLRKSADRLESDPHQYEWIDRTSCNCGILAQAITNMDRGQLSTALKELHPGSWTEIANDRKSCSITGLPMNFVVRSLLDAGMTWRDFSELECLSNKKIAERAFLDFPKAPNLRMMRYRSFQLFLLYSKCD